MFCNKCGKEIPEGSQFCPHCGYKQNGQNVKDNNFLSSINNMFVWHLGKIGTKIYYLWTLLNTILLLLGGQGYSGGFFYSGDFFDQGYAASDLFFCFYLNGHGIEFYDFTEFLLYVIVLPAIIVLIKSFFKKNKS